jgi:signal transduction histidine kinase
LLTLARADEHALALRLEQRDLGEMIADTLDRLSHEAGKRENRFVFVRPDFALPVHVDADRLEQVLLNLMDNALKNSPADGVIRVEVEKIRSEALDSKQPVPARTGARESSTSALGQWILVRIVDQGVGIPAEARGRVFDRFYRADPARDRQRGGSGLGLSIAKALIEEHGGRIWIESPSPGWNGDGLPGTQVSFALPLSE